MLRLMLGALVLIGCHHPASTGEHASEPRCPGPYAITPGKCTAAAPTSCRGTCGVVVRRYNCAPLHALIVVEGPNAAVSTDPNGEFDIGPLPPGHYRLRVSAEQDVGLVEVDVTGGPQPLPAPLELQLADRSCECGGACTN